MARTRRRKKAVQQKNILGIVLIIIVSAAVVGLAFFRYQLSQNHVEINPQTLCPTQADSPEYVALIFDKTDGYNPVQQRFLQRYFSRFKAGLQEGAQVSVYALDDQEKERLQPDFVVCAPRTGEDANALYENPKLIKKRWREQFEQPLDAMISQFLKPRQAKYSPIMEIIQSVSLTAFPAINETAGKRIIIISDMLHHTPEWSHYRGQLSVKKLKKTAYFQRINTFLDNAEVEILYVRRPGKANLQTKRHAYFWADFIKAIGGRVTSIEKIDG